MHLDGDVVTAAITLITMVGMVALGPLGRALADRLRGKGSTAALMDLEERLDEISGQAQAVQRQLGEIVERQDFTERLLSRAMDRGALEAPK